MANHITMQICGHEYTLVAEERADYMKKVGSMVDQRMAELMEKSHMGRDDAAVLTAVNLADELLKSHDNAENLRRQLKTYLDEANEAKNQASELKRQLLRTQSGRPDRK